jgi:DNA-binding beta-propeller fold protein YncE
LVVTADWLNRSLTLFDHAQLTDPRCSAEEARVDTVDLSKWPPGPLEVEITPDGKTAVVAVGAGFFVGLGGALVGSPRVPAGGALLLVDLETRAVVAELAPKHAPMGIAITPDGKRALTANYGEETKPGSTVSVVDLAARAILADVEVGQGPEQLALSEDGSFGMVNVDSAGGVRLFETGDVAGTLGPVVPTGRDPSDSEIVGDRALVCNSLAFGFSVLDVAKPARAKVLESRELGLGTYAATRVAKSSRVLVSGQLATLSLVPVDLGADPVAVGEALELPASGVTLVVAVDPAGRFAFTAHPGERALVVVDLETRAARTLSWLGDVGPTYVAVQP